MADTQYHIPAQMEQPKIDPVTGAVERNPATEPAPQPGGPPPQPAPQPPQPQPPQQ